MRDHRRRTGSAAPRGIAAPLCAALPVALGGCPEDPQPPTPPPGPSYWPGSDRRPQLEHPFFETHPELAGHYGEYMVYDDLSAFQPVYDPAGGIGDYTARHRPWEGGIDLDAFLLYLAGSLVGSSADIALRPHLPNNLPQMTLNGERVVRFQTVTVDPGNSTTFLVADSEPEE